MPFASSAASGRSNVDVNGASQPFTCRVRDQRHRLHASRHPPVPADTDPQGSDRSDTTDIDLRRRQITDQIAALGPTLPGSLVTQTSRCGNRGCRCQTDPDQRHGPTGPGAGKTITIIRALSHAHAERYRPWFANDRRLRELVDQPKKLAIEQAETDPQWPAS